MIISAQKSERSLFLDLGMIGVGVFLMVCAAKVRIPLFFSPVPLTLQTFVLFLTLALLKRKAVIVQLLYISLGLMGCPVFTNGGSGLSYFAGATGGYLLGFVISSYLGGIVCEQMFQLKELKLAHFIALFAGVTVVVYIVGLGWLQVVLSVNLATAFSLGIIPFLLGDSVKIVFASLLCKKVFSHE